MKTLQNKPGYVKIQLLNDFLIAENIWEIEEGKTPFFDFPVFFSGVF